MPASKAQQKAVNKYVKANYDLYQIKMPKGKKDGIKAVAAAAGESMNQYIINAIDQRTALESAGGTPSEALGEEKTSHITTVQPIPKGTLKAAQEGAQAAGEGLPQFIARAVLETMERDKMKGGEPNE